MNTPWIDVLLDRSLDRASVHPIVSLLRNARANSPSRVTQSDFSARRGSRRGMADKVPLNVQTSENTRCVLHGVVRKRCASDFVSDVRLPRRIINATNFVLETLQSESRRASKFPWLRANLLNEARFRPGSDQIRESKFESPRVWKRPPRSREVGETLCTDFRACLLRGRHLNS